MKRLFCFLLTFIVLVLMVFFIAYFCKGSCRFGPERYPAKLQQKKNPEVERGLALLRVRKDSEALIIFDKLLAEQPDNIDALWGEAEVLRRSRDYKNSEEKLNEILKKNPGHVSSITSLAYIKYKEDKLNDALKLISSVLENKYLDNKNQALCFLMLGAINGRRCEKGGLFSKIKYGTNIRGYFLKAKQIAPDLPEVHLGLGAFYLLAPAIVGGNIDKALHELELAVRIAPDFATANARLAQYYKKKGDLARYNTYIKKVKELDPDNEVLKEIDNRL